MPLVDITGASTVMLSWHMLADPGFELVTPHRRVLPSVRRLGHLPRRSTSAPGVPPDAAPGTAPCSEYDPRCRSLWQRELAKHAELTAAAQGCAEHAAAAAAPI